MDGEEERASEQSSSADAKDKQTAEPITTNYQVAGAGPSFKDSP